MSTMDSHSLGGRLQWSGCSDRGRFRANNEDSFVGLRFNRQELERLGKEGNASLQSADFVFAVSDGMGGAQAGEIASRMAVEKVPRILPKGFRPPASRVESESPESLLHTLFHEIHQSLVYLGRSYEECRGMETTLSLCWFAPGLLHFAHVGDSRIYRLRQERFEQVTRDHSLVNLYADNPSLAAKFGPANENVIVRAVGLREEVEVDHRAMAVESDDLFLLCSDGLTDMVDDWILKELLQDVSTGGSTLDECADAMIRAALSNGGVDNVTAHGSQAKRARQNGKVSSHTNQGEACNQHAGNGTGSEGQGQTLGQTFRGGLGRSHIGANRHEHADKACQARKNCTRSKADSRQGADQGVDRNENHSTDHGDRGILFVQVGLSALLNGRRDFLHFRVTGRGPH